MVSWFSVTVPSSRYNSTILFFSAFRFSKLRKYLVFFFHHTQSTLPCFASSHLSLFVLLFVSVATARFVSLFREQDYFYNAPIVPANYLIVLVAFFLSFLSLAFFFGICDCETSHFHFQKVPLQTFVF